MNKKKMISMTSLVAVAAIAVFTISPYFYDVTVDESLPTAFAELPSGTFVGSGDGIHEAEGDVLSLKLEDGSQYVRFENFKSTNGPDLYVYLATDDQATDFVSLGLLKGNVGNQNYEIPEGVDLSKYNKVLIWCKAFSILFGSAELA
jgi:hypothetical protein